MVLVCAVQGCCSESHVGCLLTFHGFPKDEAMKQKWLAAIGRTSVSKYARICQKHFEDDCFFYSAQRKRNQKLKPNVVPTKFLNIGLSIAPKRLSNLIPVSERDGAIQASYRHHSLAGIKMENILQNSSSEMRCPTDTTQGETWVEILGMPTETVGVGSNDNHNREYYKELEESATSKVCRLCLSLNVMHQLKDTNLGPMYEDIVGIRLAEDKENVPTGVCWECAAKLLTATKFKSKALVCHHLLQDHLKNNSELKIKDILRIHDMQSNLKSTMTVEETYKFDSDVLEEDSAIKTEFTAIPLSKENEIEVDDPIRNNATIKDEKDIKFADCIYDDGFKTEVDLVPSDVVNKNFNLANVDFTDNDFFDNIEADEANIDNVILIEDEDKKVNDGATNTADVLNPESETSVGIESLVDNTVTKKAKGGSKRKYQYNEDDIVVWVRGKRKTPYVKPSIPVDENVFTVKPLSLEQVKQEILDRKDSDKYLMSPYKCTVCYKGFPDPDKHSRHMLKHSEKSGPIKCNICKIRMKKSRNLRAHMKQQHTVEYTCKLCPMVTRTKHVALGHVKYHQGNKFKCAQCSAEFEKQTTYLNHLRLKHLTDSVCELCGFTFVGKLGVQTHKHLRHKFADVNEVLKGPYCEVCDVKFLNKNAYEKHLRLSSKHIKGEGDPNRISNDPAIRIRRIGGSTSTDSCGGTDVRRSATTAGPITCEQCGVVVESLRLYGAHFKYSHPGVERTQYAASLAELPYMCEHCGKMFLNKTTLSCHMWVHTGEKGFQCDHCNKTFSMKTNLAGHMRCHEAVRPSFSCAVCGKLFAFKHNLNRHMFQHTGMRPFKCDACEKTFKTLGERRSHVDYVHLNKPRPKRVRRRAKKCDLPNLEY